MDHKNSKFVCVTVSAVPCDPSREHFIPRGRRVVSIVQLPNKVNKGKSCAAAGEKRAPYYNSCVILKKEEKLLSATHSPRKPQNDDALEDIMDIFFSFSFMDYVIIQ